MKVTITGSLGNMQNLAYPSLRLITVILGICGFLSIVIDLIRITFEKSADLILCC